MIAIPVKNVKGMLYITYSGTFIDLNKVKEYKYVGAPEYGLIIKTDAKSNSETK